MYERNFGGNVGRFKNFSGIPLFNDFIGLELGFGLGDCLVVLHGLIDPIIDSDGTLGVLLYLISEFEAWQLSFPEDIMQGRRTNIEFLGYSALLFIVTFHPIGEFVQFVPLFCWFTVRKSGIFVLWKEKALTCIEH